MSARDLAADLSAAGISLWAERGRLIVEPASKLTPAMRERIRLHRPELLAMRAIPADLRCLIGRVAAHFKCLPDELRLMLEIASGDPESARVCFETTARMEGIA